MDIHTLVMLLAASAVIWLICAPHKQIQESHQPLESKKAEEEEHAEEAVHDMSIPL